MHLSIITRSSPHPVTVGIGWHLNASGRRSTRWSVRPNIFWWASGRLRSLVVHPFCQPLNGLGEYHAAGPDCPAQ